MFEKDYMFWIDYHAGKINRELTEREKSEIIASEFAMNLLLPDEALLQLCGGYENLESVNASYAQIKSIAKQLSVPETVVYIKTSDLIRRYNESMQDSAKREGRWVSNLKSRESS